MDSTNSYVVKIQDLVNGLHSEMRRNIILLLCDKDRTSTEIYRELKEKAPKFRQSVNRALDILVQYGCVRKYYDENRKALYYQLSEKEYKIDLRDMSVSQYPLDR